MSQEAELSTRSALAPAASSERTTRTLPLEDPLAPPSSSAADLSYDIGAHTKPSQVYRLFLDGQDPLVSSNQQETTAIRSGASVSSSTSTSPPPTTAYYDSSTWIIAGAVANLCSATLGAGVLALPYALLQAGLVVGGLLLLVSAASTVVSIQLIAQACEYYELYTYEALVDELFGKRWRTAVELSIVVFCGGCAVAYIVTVGDILEQSHFLLHGSRTLSCLVVWCVAMVPLSLLRRMQSLQFASGLGVASIGTLVFAALVHYVDSSAGPSPSTPLIVVHSSPTTLFYRVLLSTYDSAVDTAQSLSDVLWPAKGFVSVLTAAPIVLFSFSCQVNVCQIYHELDIAEGGVTTIDEEVYKTTLMKRVSYYAVGLCCLLYSSISIIALADLGVAVRPNILSSYDIKGCMQVACGAMAAAVIVAFPLNIFPARTTIIGLFFPHDVENVVANASLTAALLEEGAPSIEVEPIATMSVKEEDESAPKEDMDDMGSVPSNHNGALSPERPMEVMTSDSIIAYDDDDWHLGRHVLVTLALTGSALGLALVVPDISVVFGLLGGTTSSLLGFCVPGLLGIKLGQDTNDNRLRVVSWMLLVGGVLVGVITTAVTVYTMIW